VPGELRGLEYLLHTHGHLDWDTVASPAIEAAEKGVPVTKDLLHYMDLGEADGEFLAKGPWKEVFAPRGKRIGEGDNIKRKKYAATLKAIAHANSVEPFYRGTIANETVRAVQAAGGIMTVDDLKNYHIERREPVKSTYRDHTLVSAGAPASGAVALNILKVLEKYDFGDPSELNRNTHRMVEAMKFGYGMVRISVNVYCLAGG
jgi:gamma-glutamyltranspeptidase/glutathione hydrolase